MQTKTDITSKSDFTWNMIGSVCYSFSSFYYLMLVTRICGVFDGGVFALAFATAQLLLTFGRYGMRTYQATDTERIYSFKEYGVSRIITCVGMVVLSLPYCLAMRYNDRRVLVFVLVAALKMIDAVEDVYHGELQRSGYVARMGKMLALRNTFSCVVFGLTIVYTNDLLLTCSVTDVLSLVFCLIINGAAVRSCCPLDKRLSSAHVQQLFAICFPIFVSTFLSLFLYNIPKYAIDRFLTEDYQTYYSVLFMPSFVITLFSEIITRPVLTTISVTWKDDLPRFRRIVERIFLLIVVGTLGVVLGGHFIGRWLLELLYGVDLDRFKLHFIVLLVGGGVSAAVYISYNILISIRAQRYIIIGYAAVALGAAPITYAVVSRFGMLGAACSYLVTCLALEAVFGSILVWQVHKKYDGQKIAHNL